MSLHWLLTNCAAPLLAPFYTGERRPPLGIGFLISALRRAGQRVSFIDNYLQPADFLDTDYLVANRVDVLGISVNTICCRDFRRMTERLRRLRERGVWRGRVVVGGPHVAAQPESIPAWVDHLVLGEGEQAVVDIAAGRAERIVRAARVRDLDSLAPPAWDVFAGLPYDWSVAGLAAKPVFTMNTSRGCPFDCSFCSVATSWGREYRCFSAAWVLEQIKHLMAEYGCRGVYFREDNFTVNRRRVEALCEGLLHDGIRLEWMCETRVDTLDRPLLEQMHRAGCRGLYVGVESGSQRLLDYMNKGITLAQVEQIFAWCREIGLHTYASFMVGIPTETPAERAATRALSERLGGSTHGTGVFVGIPKSRLYHQVLAQGLHAHIDDRGLVYLKDHDALVDQFYHGDETRKVPWPFREHLARSIDLLDRRRYAPALAVALRAVLAGPLQRACWRQAALCLLRRPPAGRTAAAPPDPRACADRVRSFVKSTGAARRLVVYGAGKNGRSLLTHLSADRTIAGCQLYVADDSDDPRTCAALNLPQDDPRRWRSWPPDTVAVITPNDCRTMRRTLCRAGGCEGTDFIVLADPV